MSRSENSEDRPSLSSNTEVETPLHGEQRVTLSYGRHSTTYTVQRSDVRLLLATFLAVVGDLVAIVTIGLAKVRFRGLPLEAFLLIAFVFMAISALLAFLDIPKGDGMRWYRWLIVLSQPCLIAVLFPR